MMLSSITEVLLTAIRTRNSVEFSYDGLPRTVYPAALGNHRSTGNLQLRGYQVGGTSSSRVLPLWDLFLVSKIRGLSAGVAFSFDPPGYRRDDKHLSVIHAQL